MNIKYLYTVITDSFYLKLVLLSASIIVTFSSVAQEQTSDLEQLHSMVSKYYSASDTALFKNKQRGIIPVPLIVTEPALGGFGGGLALGYVHSNDHSLRKNTPTTITGVFGGMTMNKSWMYGLGHTQSFFNDHMRYMGFALQAKANMTFYEEILSRTISFNVDMKILGTGHKLLFRIGETDLFLGPSYIFLQTKNGLDLNTNHPLLDSLLNSIEKTSRLGMLGLAFTYDNRDNNLSPNHGFETTITYDYNATFFGGDENFSKMEAFGKYFFQVAKPLYGAVRLDGQFTGDDTPFYAKPFVDLRGVPAMRYQGNAILLAETQWRCVLYKDISVLGFVGAAKAMSKKVNFKDAELIYNYGGGARYALKKLFGIRVGADAAWSNDDFAWYISVGSSF